MPAPVLFGSLTSASLLACHGTVVKVNACAFTMAQGIVAMTIVTRLSGENFGDALSLWPIIISATLVSTGGTVAVGLLLQKSHRLPGTTGIWGTSPGGATPMILMSAEHGGDVRLVAVMQYLRVIACFAFAAAIASTMGSTRIEKAPLAELPGSWSDTVTILAIAFVLSSIGKRIRLQSGAFLLPLLVAGILKFYSSISLPVPPLAGIFANCLIGWAIGMRFSKEILIKVWNILHIILFSILCIIAICAINAIYLIKYHQIDPLTAFLATSPGGVDTITIIAMSMNVDLHFVFAMQAARFFVVLLLSPTIARWLSCRVSIIGK